MALPSWSNSQIISQLINGSRWYGESISYAFPTLTTGITGAANEAQTFSPLTAAQQSIVQLAMSVWGDLIHSDVVLTTGSPDIRFGLSVTATEYAHSYFPPNGSVWFNATDAGLLGPAVGNYSFETYLHEIGHALGLEHMGDYNGSGNNRASCYQDSSVFSIMSYFGPEHRLGQGQVAWADWVGADGRTYAPQTPMLNDVMAIQEIYGKDITTRVANTVYGFNCNISGSLSTIYDFSKNLHPILTIYDAAGTDTLDLSGYNTASAINLGEGQYSSCNSMTNNIAIAYGCAIENATGGSGDDTITGNALANCLIGGKGNDVIEGAGGLDWSVYDGKLAEYQTAVGADHKIRVADSIVGRDGSDVLSDVERLYFADYALSFDVSGAAGKAYRLYKAAFDRAPDYKGLGFWVRAMDQGVTQESVAGGFIASDEFATVFGTNSTNDTFVSLLYRHVLHRDPDAAGAKFWNDALNWGATRAHVLSLFSESPENLGQTELLVVNGIQYQPWS